MFNPTLGSVHATELQNDTIRLTFHFLLKVRVYPTLQNLLSTLLAQEPDFPVTSKTSLQRELTEMGFKYGQTKKAQPPTPALEPPKRAWRKSFIAEWLQRHRIKSETFTTKAELLESAFQNFPRKEYPVNRNMQIAILGKQRNIFRNADRIPEELENEIIDSDDDNSNDKMQSDSDDDADH
ncbi:unnamed protein product [Didymodactylos carnosus]|uniref:Uncharacterized protein n=1 Tax=Didymodactylos carnosus TaxID=1234261 RepID=A0A814FIL0_9BILA|nr:unnamed protein product [Didymodactylos carnosus]CAF1140183.1 unnamed protein product [Didymodactylos carnosus]CAF3754360.1 unnamed protein product [Didymodactylos carnosus]CAF3934244.1 unnamed protein product [Didymodactylos carnosus]